MKHKFLFLLFGLMGLFAIGSAFNRNGDTPAESAGVGSPEKADVFAAGSAVGGYNLFNFRKDTITNAEKDTIPIGVPNANNIVSSPVNFLSLYTYDISILRASLSGTHNVKVYLDKSNVSTSGTQTDWFTIDSTSTTSATTAMLRSTDATGVKYRLRINGTGTQSSTYTIWTAWKKKN